MLAHILQRQGFHVDAADGDGIVRRLREAVYDAMILDIEIDGIRDFLHASPQQASRIIITTPVDIDELPVHAILRKPIELSELVSTTRRCVNPE